MKAERAIDHNISALEEDLHIFAIWLQKLHLLPSKMPSSMIHDERNEACFHLTSISICIGMMRLFLG